MRTRWLAVLVLTAALGLFAPYSFADHGNGHGKGNPHADRDNGRGHARGHDRDDDARWERHGDYEVRVFEVREGRPRGWSQGKKVGWGNCGMPPGQAKKYGECRTYVYERRRYYYYEDAGRIILRRPRIDIHATIH